jgi:hypothetical protein
MIIQSGQPNFLWAEAIRHSVWLRNRAITRAIPEGKTPHEVATGERPNLAGLLEWGSRIWVKKLDVQKLEPRALEAVFVGYDDESKGYRVYWPSDTAQIEGETATRANSGGFTTSIPPKPIKTITDLDSTPKDLSNAPLNAQNEQKLTNIEPSQSDTTKTPEKHPNSSYIPFPHEKLPENEPEDVENSNLGRSKRDRKPEGYYEILQKGKRSKRGNLAR